MKINYINCTNETSENNNNILFVFLVGINSEWDEGRDTVGDKALFRTLKETYNIPSHRMRFIKDSSATKRYVVKKLRSFLQQTLRNSTFFFYYGGHGNTTSLCTLEEELSHVELCQLVKDYFQGDMVWFVIDCCYSGNFYDSILLEFDNHSCCSRENRSSTSTDLRGGDVTNFTTACIMSTQQNHRAGGEWTLTECWISAIRKEDILGKGRSWTVDRFLGFTADKTVEIKGDVLTFQVYPYDQDSIEKVCNSTLFSASSSAVAPIINVSTTKFWACTKQLCNVMQRALNLVTIKGSRSNKYANTCNNMQVQKYDDHSCWWWVQHKLSSPSQQLSVGLSAFAKWKGGWTSSQTLPDSRYIMPLWFPCKVLSLCADEISSEAKEEEEEEEPFTNTMGEKISNGSTKNINTTCMQKTLKVHVLFYDPQTKYGWDGVVSSQNVRTKGCLSKTSSVSIKRILEYYTEAHYTMAKYGKYITHSIPPNSTIYVKYWDDVIYEATVLHWKDVPWENFTPHEYWISKENIAAEIDGPYIPVSWSGEDTYSLMPLSHVVFFIFSDR
jgi:hypothetical protein